MPPSLLLSAVSSFPGTLQLNLSVMFATRQCSMSRVCGLPLIWHVFPLPSFPLHWSHFGFWELLGLCDMPQRIELPGRAEYLLATAIQLVACESNEESHSIGNMASSCIYSGGKRAWQSVERGQMSCG